MTWRGGTSAFLVVAWLASGCTALREIPPSDYQAAPERKNVRIWTSEGLEYEFDFARVENDTIVGYRRLDVEGSFENFVTLSVPLNEVARFSTRVVDWYRTGLIGGGLLAAVVAAGLATSDPPADPGNSGGGGPRVP